MKRISYQSIAYLVTHNFLNDIIAKDYLYLEDKLNNINIKELSLVDKIFVVMCTEYKHKTHCVTNELKQEYNIEISEDDVFHVLLECQCFDIEITAMAKAYLYYDFSKSEILDEQIDYINKYGEIDLPYTYEFHKIE
jgi:uncharacterized protein YlxP (DUF503 family)